MNSELKQIVAEAMQLTRASAPAMLAAGAPVLADTSVSAFYLTGLIGGKEVGKSAIVNALCGQTITDETSFGRGTETAVAYAHRSVEAPLRELLEQVAPSEHRIVLHDIAALQEQVLVDLPDIDSRWQSHAQLTRRMLRHMLFPLWITSVEKYADLQPQQMLSAVAEGNSPQNFLFCLNKTDQLDEKQAKEIQADFAARVAKLLKIDAPPVWLISAHQPNKFDFPKLRDKLSRQKPAQAIEQSRHAAHRQQDLTLLNWIDRQQLRQQADRLQRMLDSAQELLADRIGTPLLEQAIPAIADDPGHRLALVNEVLNERMSRWPVVNVLHSLLSPISLLIQKNIGAGHGSRDLIGANLQIEGRSITSLLQAAFAQLQQTQPQLADIYQRNKLWEDMPAESAALRLQSSLTEALQQQKQTIREAFDTRVARLCAPLRWILTIGALIWFPFGQPLLEAMLQNTIAHTGREIALLIVHMLGVTYLLKQVTFLLIYFGSLWALLRWSTHRRVNRLLKRWSARESDISQANLAVRVIEWIDELTTPIQQSKDRLQALIDRIERFRQAGS